MSASGTEPWTGSDEVLASLLGAPPRWTMLRELARYDHLPVSYLAGRTELKRPAASAHVKFKVETGIVQRTMGRLYRLHPSLRPAPEAEFLDLGEVRLRIRPRAPGGG